jgi:hypothetical protein
MASDAPILSEWIKTGSEALALLRTLYPLLPPNSASAHSRPRSCCGIKKDERTSAPHVAITTLRSRRTIGTTTSKCGSNASRPRLCAPRRWTSFDVPGVASNCSLGLPAFCRCSSRGYSRVGTTPPNLQKCLFFAAFTVRCLPFADTRFSCSSRSLPRVRPCAALSRNRLIAELAVAKPAPATSAVVCPARPTWAEDHRGGPTRNRMIVMARTT